MVASDMYNTCKRFLVKTAVRTGLLSRWTFNRYCTDEAKYLGYRKSRRLLSQKRKFHKAILIERDPKKRASLAMEHYNKIYKDIMALALANREFEKRTYGFVPELLEERKDLFLDKIVLDVGCGPGVSTEFISRHAKFVYGVDYSERIIAEADIQFGNINNIKFLSVGDISLPFEDECIDVVYSNDVIEHLHPEDVFNHFQEVRRVLKNKGLYYFWTPGKSSGPHDFTRNFYLRGYGVNPQASHIKEYNFGELVDILKKAKYKRAIIPDITKEVLLMAEK